MFDFSRPAHRRLHWPGEVQEIETSGRVYYHLDRLDRICGHHPPPSAYCSMDVPGRDEYEGEDQPHWRTDGDAGWLCLHGSTNMSGVYQGEDRLSAWNVDCKLVHEALCPEVYLDPTSMGHLVSLKGVRPLSLFARRSPQIVLEWMRILAHGDDSFAGFDRLLVSHPDMYFLLDACRCEPTCLDYAKSHPVLASLLAMALIQEHALHVSIYNSEMLACLYALSWIAGPSLGPLRALYNTGYALRRARDVCDNDPPIAELKDFHDWVWRLYHCTYGQICLAIHWRVTTMMGSIAVALDPSRVRPMSDDVVKGYCGMLGAQWFDIDRQQWRRHRLDLGRYDVPRPSCCPVDLWWVGDASIPESVSGRAMLYRLDWLDESPGAGAVGEFWRSDAVKEVTRVCRHADLRRVQIAFPMSYRA